MSQNSSTTHLQTSQASPPVVEYVFHVLYEQNPYFTGRDGLVEIHDKFLNEQVKGYKRRVALFRLGGVGKTRIALEYCFRYKQYYDYIVWMRSADETRLLSSFAEVATLTGSINTTSDQTPKKIAQVVLRWPLKHELRAAVMPRCLCRFLEPCSFSLWRRLSLLLQLHCE
jgi:hypothetical protein